MVLSWSLMAASALFLAIQSVLAPLVSKRRMLIPWAVPIKPALGSYTTSTSGPFAVTL